MSAEDTKPKTEESTSIPKPPTSNVFSMFGAKKRKPEQEDSDNKKESDKKEEKDTSKSTGDDNEVAEEEEADVELLQLFNWIKS